MFNRLGADTANWQNGENPDINEPTISNIIRLDNGGLMVGGRFSRYDGHEQWGLVRLLPSPVGVKEFDDEISISCFPNPASDFIRFQIPEGLQKDDVRIEIFNSDGKRVLAQQHQITGQPVDVSSLKTGLYNVVLLFNDGKRAGGRFVKIGD